jgi:hypothetical protein
MQASCTYGSVRGAPSNGRSYRDIRQPKTLIQFELIKIPRHHSLRGGHERGRNRNSGSIVILLPRVKSFWFFFQNEHLFFWFFG